MSLKTYRDNPNFAVQTLPLQENVYRQVLRSLAIVCVDIVIVDMSNKTFLLPTRCVNPIKGLWVFGGRLCAGESYEDAAVRKLKQESSLEIEPNRLHYVTSNRYITQIRKQEPVEEGSDTIAFTFFVELSFKERDIIASNLDPSEYDVSAGLQECTRATLIKEKTHQALIDLYDLVFPVA